MPNDSSLYNAEADSTGSCVETTPHNTHWLWNRIASALLFWPATIFATVMAFIIGYFVVESAPDFNDGLEDGLGLAEVIIDVFALRYLAMGYLALLSLLEALILILSLVTGWAQTRVRVTAASLCALRLVVLWSAIVYIELMYEHRDLTAVVALNMALFGFCIFIDAAKTPRLRADGGRTRADLSRWSPGILVGLCASAVMICGMLVYSLAIEPLATVPAMLLLLLAWPIRRSRRIAETPETSPDIPPTE